MIPSPGLGGIGDIVTGAANVILAAGAGRKAATAIHEYVQWITWGEDPPHFLDL